MLNFITNNVLQATTEATITTPQFLLCIAAALVIGLLLAATYKHKSNSSSGFLATLAILPMVVAMVILMVNGNLGAGVAVAGAFSLVRFRSVPGTAQEIGALFIAMAAGLAVGMGYLALAILFTVILCIIELLYHTSLFQKFYSSSNKRQLRITIPEDLDYTDIFDDIFEKCMTQTELVEVKTTNMGSLFRLTYNVTLKNEIQEKKMIDALRCRNGNLEISLSRPIGRGEL